jgi:predicted acyl esterase
MQRGFAATWMVAAVAAACASGIASPTADAAITSVFSRTSTPIPCTVQPDGMRLCDEKAFLPARARSTVKTFDGVPIDVRVAFPPAPAGAADGPYPLIMLFHRYGGTKLTLPQMQTWLNRGYAALSITDRGFGESCGTPAARNAAPADCARGYVRMMDVRYEVRDAQELAGRLADEGAIYPRRIAATGRSYGGTTAVALAVLKDRTMLPDGRLVPWTTPRGVQMRIAAAAAQTPWTDLLASLVPNGSTLDYVSDATYRGRTGVLKQEWENALLGTGLPYYFAGKGADPSADLVGWHDLLNAGESYDDLGGNPLPAIAAMRDELTAHHSPYYVDHSVQPAPLLIAGGWTDDLFPADEAIRLYNRTRGEYPGAPISLFLADIGHKRGQNKVADSGLAAGLNSAWIEYYLRGVGSPRFKGIETLTQTCPPSAPSKGPYFASTLGGLAPGEVRVDDATPRRILPTAGSQSISATFAPLSGGGACATAPAADQDGTGTFRSGQVPSGGFTLMGSPTIVASFAQGDANSQVAARLLDVDPATNREVLVARGLWRPSLATGLVQEVFQLHPNGYRFAGGHIVKLELLPNDSPYGRISNGQQEIKVMKLQLRLPALEPAGSLGGFVQSPLPKVVPAGDTLAPDFAPAP